MRLATLTALAILLGDVAQAQPQASARPSGPDQQRIAPGLAHYTDEILYGAVWPGPGLSQRDRSLVVIAVLIATNKPAQLQGHLGRALNNGVTPVEASGVLTHLALYAGWPNAVSALAVYDKVYTARQVDLAGLKAAMPELPAHASDPARAQAVTEQFEGVAPAFAHLTNEVVFDDMWRRSDLSVRDRSLVTIAALAAMGEAEQLPIYLRRGVEAGLTQAQIGEALTQLAFYAGWPRATEALEVTAASFAVTSHPPNQPARAVSSNFTGTVSVTAPFRGTSGSRLGGATVTFAPAARTKWHSHPLGQLLIVTAGEGWTQLEGQPVRALKPGDVVWAPPGVKHWHGGTRIAVLLTLPSPRNWKVIRSAGSTTSPMWSFGGQSDGGRLMHAGPGHAVRPVN